MLSLALTFLASGCALWPTPDAKTAPSPVVVAKEPRATSASEQQPEKHSSLRKVGDYFVHRFSGSYRDAPVTLIEEVIAEEGELLVVDYTLEEADDSMRLRVRLDPRDNRIIRVSQLYDGSEVEVGIELYEAMLEKTVFTPDVNEELVSEKSTTCTVGPEELDCQRKHYRVFVGNREARLSVTQSEALPGRDVAGEITTLDGSVIYRVDLVDMGNDGRSGSFAKSDVPASE